MLDKRFDTEMIDIREKKYTVYNLYEMYKHGRLVFPLKPAVLQSLRTKAQEAMDILLLSIPFPVIYVSERQDGSLVVLESSSRLLGLLELIDRRFVYKSAGANHNLDGRDFLEIDTYAPSVTAAILEAKIRVEIIEYYTPLFLHMRTGLAVESWTIQQEQDVRNFLYVGDGTARLKWLAFHMNICNERGYSKEFCALNILLVEFVCHANWQEVASREIPDEQYLFEVVINILQSLDREQIETINYKLEKFGKFCADRLGGISFGTGNGKRNSTKYRAIAYIFQIWQYCRNPQIPIDRLERLIHDQKIWNTIGKTAHSIEGIHRNMENLRRLMEC